MALKDTFSNHSSSKCKDSDSQTLQVRDHIPSPIFRLFLPFHEFPDFTEVESLCSRNLIGKDSPAIACEHRGTTRGP